MASKACAKVLGRSKKMFDEKRVLIVFAVIEFVVIALVVLARY